MMKYKSKATPVASAGQKFTGKKLVQPDQSMSLEEILARFTRGEPVEVGREVNYHESDDDLEKISRMDITERHEFLDKQKATQERFKKQERKKATDGQKAAHDEAVRLEQAKITAAKAISGSASEPPAK